MKPLFPLPKISNNSLAAIRRKERARYTKKYFEETYWVEDIPGKKHYREFHYNDPTHEKRFRYLTGILKKYFSFKSVLDAGCGMGHMVRNLLSEGYDVKGMEVSQDAINYFMADLAKQEIIINTSLDQIPFSNNEFDLVFCSDVMEHIPIFDTSASIQELIRVTKKYLVLTINLDHPYKHHPTILSRETWETLFLATGHLKHTINLQQQIEKETKKKYNEYDWFIFEKI